MSAMPSMPSITATQIKAPPDWALIERKLIALMEKGATMMSRKYAERSGAWYWYDDLDDYYERSYNWCLLYNMGGGEHLVDLALKHWNATTRLFDDRDNNRGNCLDYTKGKSTPKRLRHSLHNEYFSLANPGNAEWHHMGEGNMAFYDFGVADPTVSENVRRARRLAALFIGDDPQAPNWDPEHRILRSPFHSSQGPKLHGDAELANTMLLAGRGLGGQANYYGVRASLYPVVEELEVRWFENAARRKQIVDLFERLVLQCDTPNSLAATALVTNAYLYTGEAKYKQWVLDYTEAWMERIRKNDGILPDNVGLVDEAPPMYAPVVVD